MVFAHVIGASAVYRAIKGSPFSSFELKFTVNEARTFQIKTVSLTFAIPPDKRRS